MPSIGIRNNIARIGSQLNLTPEVQAYISGLTTPLSSGQVGKLNKFVRTLKTGLGISALSDAFDVMYILGGETAESSLRNLVENAHHATAVNSPAFTAFEGFTGDGTSSRILTNYNEYLNAVNVARDNVSSGIYIRDIIKQSQPILYGNTNIGAGHSGTAISSHDFVFDNRNYSLCGQSYSYSYINTTGITRVGMYSITKQAQAARVFMNGLLIGTNNSPSVDLQNKYDNILASGTGAYASATASFVYKGKHLTDNQILTVTQAIESYMDSNGKGVI